MLYDAKTPLTKVLRALSLVLPGDRVRPISNASPLP